MARQIIIRTREGEVSAVPNGVVDGVILQNGSRSEREAAENAQRVIISAVQSAVASATAQIRAHIERGIGNDYEVIWDGEFHPITIANGLGKSEITGDGNYRRTTSSGKVTEIKLPDNSDSIAEALKKVGARTPEEIIARATEHVLGELLRMSVADIAAGGDLL